MIKRLLDKDIFHSFDEPEPAPAPAAQADKGDSWVGINDYLFKGIRRDKEVKDSAFVFRLDEPKEPLPPEATITVLEAAAEVFRVHAPDGPVYSRLRALRSEYGAALRAKEITPQEQAKLVAQLHALRLAHAKKSEAVIDWFMDHYFRVFDEPPPEDPDIDDFLPSLLSRHLYREKRKIGR